MSERKFCGKCGNRIEECTCKRIIPPVDPPVSTGKFMRKFNEIVLSEGEQMVRQYQIGRSGLTNGAAIVYVTNKRVLLRTYSDYFFIKTNTLQEMNIDTISGVNNALVRGFNIRKLLLALVFLVAGFSCFGVRYSAWAPLLGFVLLGVAALLVIFSRKPSYLFSLMATTTSQALATSVNVMGVRGSSNSQGILFTLVPTDETITMMLELGACIQDIKAKGDHAIPYWKNV